MIPGQRSIDPDLTDVDMTWIINCRRHLNLMSENDVFPRGNLWEWQTDNIFGSKLFRYLVFNNTQAPERGTRMIKNRMRTSETEAQARGKFSWRKIYRYKLELIIRLFEGSDSQQDKCSSQVEFCKSIIELQSLDCDWSNLTLLMELAYWPLQFGGKMTLLFTIKWLYVRFYLVTNNGLL